MLSSDNVSWTYRKWASGIAECWGKDTNHTSVTGAASNVTYLPNIFYTAPIATLSQSTTTIADSWVKYARVPATPSNGSYYINWYVYASAGDKSIELMIDVKGFWKEFTPSAVQRQMITPNSYFYEISTSNNAITTTSKYILNTTNFTTATGRFLVLGGATMYTSRYTSNLTVFIDDIQVCTAITNLTTPLEFTCMGVFEREKGQTYKIDLALQSQDSDTTASLQRYSVIHFIIVDI